MNKKLILIIVGSAVLVSAIVFGIVFACLSKGSSNDNTDTTVVTTSADTTNKDADKGKTEETTGKEAEKTEPEDTTVDETTSADTTSEGTTKADETTKADKDDTTKAETKKPSQSEPAQTTQSQPKPSQTKPAVTTDKKPSVTTKPAETKKPTDTTKAAETTKAPETRPAVTKPVNPDRTEPWMEDFKAYDKNGNEVYLSDYLGKPIILNFWATWCVPCKKEMPDFHEKYLEYGSEVQFLMVNVTGYDDRKDVQKYLNETGYTFPIIYDVDLEAVDAFGVKAYPTTFFIDAEG